MGCPWFAIEATVNNVGDLAEIVKRMAAFRKTHAQEKREEEARRTAPLKAKPANKSAIGSIDEMPSYVQSGHVKWGARVKQPGLRRATAPPPLTRSPRRAAVSLPSQRRNARRLKDRPHKDPSDKDWPDRDRSDQDDNPSAVRRTVPLGSGAFAALRTAPLGTGAFAALRIVRFGTGIVADLYLLRHRARAGFENLRDRFASCVRGSDERGQHRCSCRDSEPDLPHDTLLRECAPIACGKDNPIVPTSL